MHTDLAALFIIFGGSGDLAQRKLYPALFNLYRKGYLKEHFAVIGTARRPRTEDHISWECHHGSSGESQVISDQKRS